MGGLAFEGSLSCPQKEEAQLGKFLCQCVGSSAQQKGPAQSTDTFGAQSFNIRYPFHCAQACRAQIPGSPSKKVPILRSYFEVALASL